MAQAVVDGQEWEKVGKGGGSPPQGSQEGEQCGPELGDGVGKGPQEAPWEVEEGQAQMVRRREHHEWVNACFFFGIWVLCF